MGAATQVASMIGVLSLKDEMTPALKRTQGQIETFGRQSNTAMRGAGSGFTEFGKKTTLALQSTAQSMMAATKHATAFGATFVGVFKAADALGDIGLQAERSKIAFDKLATSAGQSSKAWIDAVRQGAMMTVTEGEAAAQAYQLMRFGLVDSAAAAEQFVRSISIVASVNPQLGSTSEAINQIQLTLSNMSFMRLDQLGISAGTVRKRMAELKKEIDGLSNEEAFRMAVLEQIDEQAQILGDDILELGNARDRLDARWGNFKEDLGLRIAQGFEGWASAIEGVIQNIDLLATKEGVIATVGTLLDYVPGNDANRGGRMAQALAENQTGTYYLSPSYVSPSAPVPMDLREFMETHMPTPSGGAADYSAWTPEMSEGYLRAAGQDWGQVSIAGALLGDPTQMNMAERAISEFNALIQQAQNNSVTIADVLERGAGMAADLFSNAAGSVADMASNASEIAQNWQSLDEKFGVITTGFDVDVFNEMQGALRDAGVEGEAAADAMLIFQLNTGQATGASQVFGGQMERLANDLREGKINAQDYANAVFELSHMDLSGLDLVVGGMVDRGDIDAAMQYIDAVSQLANYQGLTPSGISEHEANQWLSGVGLTPSEEDQQTIADQMISDLQRAVDFSVEAGPKMAAPIVDGMALSMDSVNSFADTATNDIARVAGAFDALGNKSFTFTMSTSGSGATPGAGAPGGTVGGVPEFAEGGYTGEGNAPFLAWLHPGEIVLPQKVWARPGGGGSDQGGPQHVTIMLDSRVLYEGVLSEGQRRNVTVFAGAR